MSGSTISTTVTATVTLGSSTYPSPLTVTSAGDVTPAIVSSYGAVGIYDSAASGLLTLVNDGMISGSVADTFDAAGVGVALTSAVVTNGGTIAGGAGYYQNPGADGVKLTDGSLTNSGSIVGGVGGSRNNTGGVAVDLQSATMTNTGVITGGAAATGGAAGAGNTGLILYLQTTAANSGTIAGGAGFYGGAGGTGVSMVAAYFGVFGGTYTGPKTPPDKLTNTGVITGGAGGAGGTRSGGGAGGYGVDLDNQKGLFGPTQPDILINDGTIAGGAGGHAIGLYDGSGGNGGTGVLLLYSALTNNRLITGGAGGAVARARYTGGTFHGAPGGAGVSLGDGSTATNNGTIRGGAGGSVSSYGPGYAVYGGVGGTGAGVYILSTASTLTNSATAAIIGGTGGYGYSRGGFGGAGVGVAMFGGYAGGVVVNAGTIIGGAGGASDLQGGGGGVGVGLRGGTIINTGTIIGGQGGSGKQGGTAGIGGAIGSGTLVNAGTIIGGKDGTGGTIGDAVAFAPSYGGVAPTYTGTLVVDPGAVFVGSVVANTAVADVLEFGTQAGTGTAAGTLAGIGTQFRNFNDFSFAPGAAFEVAGTYTALDTGQTIAGFAPGDTLVLDGFGASSDTYVSGVGLELGNGTAEITLGITGSFATTDFTVVDPAQGATASSTTISLNAPCFAAGTRILARRGAAGKLVETRVETLAEGDAVALAAGGTAPICWIGHRRLDLRRHPRPETAQPVLIEAGAIAEAMPRRDLLLSPDHALFLGGHLIPAKALINGTTIRQVARRAITYYHVELPAHAVLYAEGVPAESYLETGNRGAFANGGEATILHPDFAQTLRERAGCAPFAEHGPAVAAVRAAILARAAIATTADPALAIRIRPDGSAAIESRSAIPGHLTPDPRDRRRLGVKIATLAAGGTPIPLDHPDLVEGWHDPEPDGRWTDGHAIIPAALLGGAAPVIGLAATLDYPCAATLAAGGVLPRAS